MINEEQRETVLFRRQHMYLEAIGRSDSIMHNEWRVCQDMVGTSHHQVIRVSLMLVPWVH